MRFFFFLRLTSGRKCFCSVIATALRSKATQFKPNLNSSAIFALKLRAQQPNATPVRIKRTHDGYYGLLV
jgi:hypothetical protein